MTKSCSAADQRAFRNALGRFPTGVTVVTTLAPGGRRVGLTASSFNSVSLDPPLILWSLDKNSTSLDLYVRAPHYAINVLAADQIELSRHFSRRHVDVFGGIPVTAGIGGVPLLKGCTAWFECHNVHQYEGGDHVILVGRVERFRVTERPALAFHAGGYKITARHPESLEAPSLTRAAGRPALRRARANGGADDNLLSLLAQASRLASGRFKARLRPLGIVGPHWRALAALAGEEGQTVSALACRMLAQQPTVTKLIDRMETLGLVERRPAPDDRRKVLIHLTARGRRGARDILGHARLHDAELLAAYGSPEAKRLKAALRGLIERLDDRAL